MAAEQSVAFKVPSVVSVGAGGIAVGHRPRRKWLRRFEEAGFTHVVTLLSEREGALELCRDVTRAGLVSIWIPLLNGLPPTDVAAIELMSTRFAELAAVLEQGGQIFLHCSAGIHRTGMISYALLRYLGLTAEDALSVLVSLRKLTAADAGPARLNWGDQFAST